MFHGSMAATVHKEPANFGMSVCCSSPPSVGPRIHVPLGGGLGLRKCASACSASTRGWLRQASRNQEIAFVFSPYTIIVQGPTVKKWVLADDRQTTCWFAGSSSSQTVCPACRHCPPPRARGVYKATEERKMAEDEAHVVQRLTQLMRVGVPYDQVFVTGHRIGIVAEHAITLFRCFLHAPQCTRASFLVNDLIIIFIFSSLSGTCQSKDLQPRIFIVSWGNAKTNSGIFAWTKNS